MRILLLLFLLSISVFSSTIIINDNHSSYKDFETSLYKDLTKELILQQIIELKEFEKSTSNISMGKQQGNLWHHFSIENRTNEVQNRVFFISDPQMFEIEVFAVQEKKVVDTTHVGSGIIKNGSTAKVSPELKLTIAPNTTQEIYVRVYSPFTHTFHIAVYTEKDLVEHKVLKASLLYFYFGAVGALILYNLFIFLSIRDESYLLYIGFIFFYAMAQFEHNALYPLDSFSSVELAYKFSTAHIFWFAFHTLFSIKLLNIKEHYPKIDKFIMSIGYLLLALSFIGFYDLTYPIHIMTKLMVILPLFILVIAIMLHFKKNKVAKFYIIAQSFFITGSITFALVFGGVIEYSVFTRYANFVGSFTEIILFSFALAYKTRLIIKENQNQKELVDEYSKLSFLGQTIINIYHQWKSPVNNIYNSINHIEIAKEFKDKNLHSIIDDNLVQIKENTQYLKDTSLSYLNYYKGINQPKVKFPLIEELSTILKLHQQEFEKIDLKTTVDCSHSIELFTQKNILTNCLIILIENAITVFKLREIKNPKLLIEAKQEEERTVINITDNAGGVQLKNINEIFEKNHSISSSTGLGLYLLKEFLTPKIEAEVKVENFQDGARFSIKV